MINIDFENYPRLQQDAATILSRIELSEALVREANFAAATSAQSDGGPPTDVARNSGVEVQERPQRVALLDRTFAILKLAEAVERPTARRFVLAAKELFAAIGMGSSPLGVIDNALNGLKKLFVVNSYGSA